MIKSALYKNTTLNIPSEAAGMRQRQSKRPTLIHPCEMSWLEWNLVWLYVRSAARDVAHYSLQGLYVGCFIFFSKAVST